MKVNVCLCAALVLGELSLLGNPLQNPGFEKGGKEISSWRIPKYWSGALSPSTENPKAGKRCAKLTTSASRNYVWGRMLSGKMIKPVLGQKICYSAWVRGRGELLLGVIRYAKKTPTTPAYQYLWQEPTVQLTEEWRLVELEFQEMDLQILNLLPVIEVRGEGACAYVDEVDYRPVVLAGTSVSAVPSHPLASVGHPADVAFTVTRNGAPLSGSVTILSISPDGVKTQSELRLDKNGKVVFPFAPQAAHPDPWKLCLLHPDSGAAKSIYADAMEPAMYVAMSAAAKKIPRKNRHFLFVGDSLSDFDRGHNYVDKVGFWLAEAGGSCKNVGVGGDFISRVWQRLNQDPKSYRLEMYKDIFSPRPDQVFIFLGHNDSKANSATNYSTHCVAPETFSDEYRKTVRKIQADTGARITVVSASSSVYEITKAAADKRAAAGKRHNLFGRPDHLELFNTRARQVAEETGCAYLDVYTPTRDYADKPSLFRKDGVHLSNLGNRFIALQYLLSLGSAD